MEYMKIYFDGCSRTWGGELDNREQDRFSALVCKELGAEEYNISKSMASNERIARQLIIDNDIKDYDAAIIQMTFPSRTEYYDKIKEKFLQVAINSTPLWKKWKNVTYNNAPAGRLTGIPDWSLPNSKKSKCRGYEHWTEDDRQFWLHYFTDIYNDYYGSVKEKIIYYNIKDHCKANNVPLVLMTNNNWDTNLKFDIQIEQVKYPKTKGGHETKEGHQLLARDILSLLTTYK